MYNQENRIKSSEERTKNIVKRNSSIKILALSFLFTFFYSLNSFAQCAMCRAVLETEEGGVKAEAVNDGIVYLMAFPYILVFVIFYIIYKTRQKKKV